MNYLLSYILYFRGCGDFSGSFMLDVPGGYLYIATDARHGTRAVCFHNNNANIDIPLVSIDVDNMSDSDVLHMAQYYFFTDDNG